jgi:hypothetical protein
MDMGAGEMSFFSADEQCVMKVEKYSKKIDEAYRCIAQMSADDIEDSLYGFALAQCMTNLYETILRVNSDRLSEMLFPLLKRTRTSRNIASHDYDSLNWDIVKQNCKAIISFVTPEVLLECKKIRECEKAEICDYTE